MVACLSRATIFNFPRRLQHKTFLSSKTSSRGLQDVFPIHLPQTSSRRAPDAFNACSQDVFKTFSKRLQDAFKTCSKDVFFKSSWRDLQDIFMKMSCSYVLKTSWKTKKCYTKYVFKASSVRLHQNECLLGACIGISLVACSITLHHKHPRRLFQLMFESMRGNILQT